MPEGELKKLYDSLGLAMTFKDFLHIQNYFHDEEHRDPTMTEIRVLDTYWSDHCRHTTFSTELTDVTFKDGYYRKPMEATYNQYLADRAQIFKGRKDKFVCLMDLALMAMRKLKAEGKLADQEESDEINACSIVVPVEVDGKTEEWLVNFKNETHNHPTEIEPFGGAATCLGGAIRDPLYIRLCVLQVPLILRFLCQRRFTASSHRRSLLQVLLTDTAHMVTRSDLRQATLRRFIILIMLQREWKSVLLWVLHLVKM